MNLKNRKEEEVMKLKTKYLGEVKIDDKKTLDFPNGLPGFPDETNFIMLELPNNALFQLLQSTKTSSLAFVITNPYVFYKDYELKLEEELLNLLKINKSEDVAVFVIVTLNNPFKDSTINLRAPVVINTKEMIGKQYILNDSLYSSRATLTPKEEGNA